MDIKNYSIENLRNVGIIGHSGSGKTTLTEALINYTGLTDRMGRIEDGNTVTDFDPEEKKRQISIQASVAPIEYEGVKINLVDIPGYFDFIGESIQGMRAVDIAMIVLPANANIEVGTEKAWKYCTKIKLPKSFFINKLDRENADFDKTFEALKEKFGMSVVPVQYPIGKEDGLKGVINVVSGRARIHDEASHKMVEAEIPEEYVDKVKELKEMVMESVAQTDEVLLDKFLNEGILSEKEIYDALIKGCVSGDITTVMCGSAQKQIGLTTLLEDIIEAFPSPQYAIAQKAVNLQTNEEEFIGLDSNKPTTALVFKTIADPFVGKISLFRVITGSIDGEVSLFNTNRDKVEKLSNIFFLRGKNQTQTKKIIAGDIGAVAKLAYTKTGDSLCDPNFKVIYDKLNFPNPSVSMTIIPKAKGDEDKIGIGLQKLMEEDPTICVKRDNESAETIVSGIGETHLEVLASKLKEKFGTDVELKSPRIAYRETIKKISSVQGKHKKQSGGHGQYGDVKIKFEPRTDGEDDLLFVDEVVGGVVPKNFIPAVEKGLRECIKEGTLIGAPVIKLKATLYDGSYHPVDSSEMAFKIAAHEAFKKGMEEATPVLLEPVMKVTITVPENYMGDVISDINKKRGRMLGMDTVDGETVVNAEIPQAEMLSYSSDLRSMTQARAEFTSEFERYEEVPQSELQKVIEKVKKDNEERLKSK